MTTDRLCGFFYWTSITMWIFLAVYTPLTIVRIAPWWGMLVAIGAISVVALIVTIRWVASLD